MRTYLVSIFFILTFGTLITHGHASDAKAEIKGIHVTRVFKGSSEMFRSRIDENSYYYEDGSFHFETPHSAIHYDPKKNKYFFSKKPAGKTMEIAEINRPQRKVTDTKKDSTCKFKGAKKKCRIWLEKADTSHGEREYRTSVVQFEDLFESKSGAKRINKSRIQFFGANSAESKGLPFKATISTKKIYVEHEVTEIKPVSKKNFRTLFIDLAKVQGKCDLNAADFTCSPK